MKYKVLIASLLLSFCAFAQPRELLGTKGWIYRDTLRNLYTDAATGIYNKTDSTLANDTTLIATRLRLYKVADSLQALSQGRLTLTTTGTSGAATLVGNTLNIPQYSGGGSTTTVEQDSALLQATSHAPTLTIPLSGRKGVLIRDINTIANQSSPPLVWQGYTTGRNFWRAYIVGANRALSFDYSSDTTTWTNGFYINYTGGIVTPNTAGLVGLNFGNGQISGAKILFDGRGYGSVGVAALTNPATFQLTPYDVNSNYAFGLPRITGTQRVNSPSGVLTGTIASGGSGYTNGTYAGRAFTGGSGTGATATFTVSGGVITSVTTIGRTTGTGGYKVGDVLSVAAANVGGTGSGFQFTVTGLYGDQYDGNLAYDSSNHKPFWWDANAHAARVVIDSTTISGNLTVSSAATLTLVAGNDYIANGTTTTYTLPAVSSTAIGRMYRILIKNRGSGAITLNSNAGSTLYTTSAQSTITIAAGASCELLPDATYFNVLYNQ